VLFYLFSYFPQIVFPPVNLRIFSFTTLVSSYTKIFMMRLGLKNRHNSLVN